MTRDNTKGESSVMNTVVLFHHVHSLAGICEKEIKISVCIQSLADWWAPISQGTLFSPQMNTECVFLFQNFAVSVKI